MKSILPNHHAICQNHAIQQHQPDSIQERRPIRFNNRDPILFNNSNGSNDTANWCNSTWLDNQSERLSSIPNLKDSAQPTRVTQLNNEPVRLSPKYTRESNLNNKALSSTTIQRLEAHQPTRETKLNNQPERKCATHTKRTLGENRHRGE